jgi:hypothetical protein
LVPSTFKITTTADTGDGSLRQAILEANDNKEPGRDTIAFDIAGAPNQVRTITLTTELPVITRPVEIDGFTQPGSQRQTDKGGPNLLIQLDVAGGTRGLEFGKNASKSLVEGLAIYTSKSRSDSAAIRISGADSVQIKGNFLGVTAAGSTPPNGPQLDYGVDVVRGTGVSHNGTIGGTAIAARNLISNNRQAGVRLDAKAFHYKVLGNYIGTNPKGDAALGKQGVGVEVDGGSNQIGNAEGRNLISGNLRYGIQLTGHDTTVKNNDIGTKALDNAAVGNGIAGIFIANDPQRVYLNVIGGAHAGNIIAGNNTSKVSNGGGVVMAPGSTATARNGGTRLIGNYIGVSHQGIVVPNYEQGVLIESSSHNVLGDTVSGTANLIAGNIGVGVHITGQGADHNVLVSNFIGTDGKSVGTGGRSPYANSGDGVLIDAGAASNTIGAPLAGKGNVISGNNGNGVHIDLAKSTRIINNHIGTSENGTEAVPNGQAGLRVEHASSTRVGGLSQDREGVIHSEGNVISGNLGAGVSLNDSDHTEIVANIIGLSSNQKKDLGNKQQGILVDGSSENTSEDTSIGGHRFGTAEGEGNVISANLGDGLTLTGGSLRTTVINNAIGTVKARNATAERGNGGYGVDILASSNNVIGTPAEHGGNLVVHNKGGSIRVAPPQGGQANFNAIRGNRMSGGGGAIQLANGANRGRGAPSLANKAGHASDTVTIAGSLLEQPLKPYRIDFYGLNSDGVSNYITTILRESDVDGVITFKEKLADLADGIVSFRATATFVKKVDDNYIDEDTSVLSNAAS